MEPLSNDLLTLEVIKEAIFVIVVAVADLWAYSFVSFILSFSCFRISTKHTVPEPKNRAATAATDNFCS